MADVPAGRPSPAPATAGGCLCGQVRFELSEPVRTAGYCHCTRCQGRTGGVASLQATVRGDTFTLLEGEESLGSWRHPDGGFAKFFCRECGAHLFSRNPENPAEMSVRFGAFDGDPGVRAQWHAFVGSAPPWDPVPDDGLPRYEGRVPRD